MTIKDYENCILDKNQEAICYIIKYNDSYKVFSHIKNLIKLKISEEGRWYIANPATSNKVYLEDCYLTKKECVKKMIKYIKEDYDIA